MCYYCWRNIDILADAVVAIISSYHNISPMLLLLLLYFGGNHMLDMNYIIHLLWTIALYRGSYCCGQRNNNILAY